MSLRRPSFTEVLTVSRSHGRLSEHPQAWGGLVGLYTSVQGGGKKWIDVSGYGRDGTLNGPTWASSTKGPVLSFNGSSDFFTTPFPPSMRTAGTVLIFIKFGSLASFSWVFSEWGAGNNNDEIELYTSGGDTINFRVYQGAAQQSALTATLVTGQWYMIGAAWSADNVGLYVDGIQVGIDTSASMPDTAGATLYWAKRETGNNLQCQIALAAIYDCRLSAAVIADHAADEHYLTRLQSFPWGAVTGGAPPAGIGGNPLRMESPLVGAL